MTAVIGPASPASILSGCSSLSKILELAFHDGRRAGTPLSEGISPVQGADRLGPAAVIRSAARMDHVRTGGR